MTSKRVFITGLEGFTGQYLAEELSGHGYEIFGTVHRSSQNNKTVYNCELSNTSRLTSLLTQIKPNYIIHLAGIAFVGHAGQRELYEANQLGTLSLLNAIDQSQSNPQKIILPSSAHVYGLQDKSPIKETSAPQPNTDYAVSKYAMEQLATLWFDRLPIVITRPFNYTGVGQSPLFLLPKIVTHFVQKAKAIELGNIDVSRDWSDVRDVVAIYRSILESEMKSMIVNVCSGSSHSIAYILEAMRQLSGYNLDVQIEQNLVRTQEIKELRGDNNLLRSYLGDTHIRPLHETLTWMFHGATN